eukprot:5631352-Alexandrium_andersonii.AAC.1
MLDHSHPQRGAHGETAANGQVRLCRWSGPASGVASAPTLHGLKKRDRGPNVLAAPVLQLPCD